MGDPFSVSQQRVEALAALQQPLSALQGICRAVFGVQADPDTSTLSALYDLGRQYLASSSSDGYQAALTASAAAWTLLIDSRQPSLLVLRQFVQDLFLPLVVALGDNTPQGVEQLEQLAQLLTAVGAWRLVLEVLQAALTSLQDVLQPVAPQHLPCQGHASPTVQLQLPPAAACAIVAQLVPAACSHAAGQSQQQQTPADSTEGAAALQLVLQLAAGPLFQTALQLLTCADSRMRQAAFQQLLPELLGAAAALGPAQHRACLDQLLQQCLDMVSRPVVPRRMGLAVLLQYWSDWGLQPPAAAPDSQPNTPADSSSSERFWQLLRECLVDPEPLNRKRALRLLQLLLPKAQLQSEPVWGVLLALYELLEEFTAHLVKATWPMISHLHRAAPAYAAEDAATDVASSKKLNLLSRGQQAATPASQQQQQGQQQQLGFCWSSIIWTQALQHNNLQVQRMAMKTLLKRDWTALALQQVPVTFLTQVLVPALLSPVHYNTQQMGKVTNSGAVIEHSTDTFDVTKQASHLLSSYVLCASPAAARELFTGSLQAVAAMGRDLSRSGLQSVLQVLAAAAAAAGQLQDQQRQQHGIHQGLTGEQAEAYAEASLQQLQLVLIRLMAWHGTAYKASCCSCILNVAAAVAPPGSCRLSTCTRLVQEVPLWMLSPGGPVSCACRAWLSGGSDSSSSSNSSQVWLAEAAGQLWRQYFTAGGRAGSQHDSSSSTDAPGAEQPQQQCATDADYALWRVASDAWLRVALCCGQDLQEQLAGAVSELATWADQVMSRPYLTPGLPDRVLIMTTQLLEATEVARRVACQQQQQQQQHTSTSSSSQDGPMQPPALTRAALQFAAGAGGSALTRLLRLHSTCFASSPSEPCGQGSGATPGKGPLALGLSLAAWQAAARAAMTARAVGAAVVLLAEYVAAVEQHKFAVAAAGDGAGVSVQQALQALLQLMQSMAQAGQAVAAKPLPRVGTDKAAGDEALSWVSAASAAELSRAFAVEVLRHLSQGLSRALSCLPRQHLPHAPLPLEPAAWTNALLRETAAAADAVTHWEPALAAAGATGDVSEGWVKGLDWACLDSCMALTGLLSPQAGSTANGAASVAAAAGTGGSAERLPAGVLGPEVLGSVLVEGLQALQWTHDALLHLLRCIRRVWALAVADGDLQAAAMDALAAAGLDAPTPAHDAAATGNSCSLVHLAASLGQGLLQVLHSNKKRPLLLCAALVNTLLLPELMLFDPQQQPGFVPLHAGPDAPLRRFVWAVLQHKAGSSPTLPVVVALRLGACIPAAPQLLGWYADELKYLLLFGGPMEGGFETKASLGHEAATEWALLAEPLEPHLAAAGVLAGMGPRIAVVAALHQLAVAAGLLPLPEQGAQSNGHSSTAAAGSGGSGGGGAFPTAAAAAGAELWRVWMAAARQDPVLSCDSCRHGSDVHRSKVRMWQGLAATAAFLGCSSQQAAATQAVKDLLTALEAVNPPSVKQYQEAPLTYLLLRHQHLIAELLLPQLVDLEKGGPATASHILIAVQASLHSSQQGVLLPQLVQLLLPWTNHHTHNIRTFAQLGLCALFEARPLDSWPAWQQGLGPGGVGMLAALQRFFEGNADFQRFRRSVGSGMLAWAPGKVVTPAGIFCNSLSLAGTPEGSSSSGPVVTFEGCPESLMDTVLFFLAEERSKLREAAADKVAADAAADAAGLPAAAGGSAGSTPAAPVGSGLQLDYQRKVTPSERAVLLADVLEDAYEAAQVQGATPSGPAGTTRHQLVVVASLIDKVPNLAGLARTAEVLGAGTLVLSDLRVANESVFTSISVTAERWVPMLEVKEAELLGWLKKQKAAGYSLVGLEQTAESTLLPSYTFPTRTVLVLGREKEGIPPEIISLLDATVEIPQGGVIRSLNVHVSGAIAMYEYTKQQLRT